VPKQQPPTDCPGTCPTPTFAAAAADTWRPGSFYDRIASNRRAGLHTLCLLDIKVREPSLESLARGKKVYEPPRFMTINTAVEQLLEIEAARGEGAYGADTLCVGVARIGSDSQAIVAGGLAALRGVDFGPPLHSLVIAGDTHPIELEYLSQFMVGGAAGEGGADGGSSGAGAAEAAADTAIDPQD
jgi:diphthine synthase